MIVHHGLIQLWTAFLVHYGTAWLRFVQTWKSFDLSQGSDDCRLRGFVRIKFSEKCRQPGKAKREMADLQTVLLMHIFNRWYWHCTIVTSMLSFLQTSTVKVVWAEWLAIHNLELKIINESGSRTHRYINIIFNCKVDF